MSNMASQVWQDYTTLLQQGNTKWHDLLSDEIEFIGPLQQAKGKPEFIKLSEDFFQMVTGFDIHRHVASENTVVTECTIKLNAPKGGDFLFDVVEFYQVEDGKIQSIKIYYDPREFLQQFSM